MIHGKIKWIVGTLEKHNCMELKEAYPQNRKISLIEIVFKYDINSVVQHVINHLCKSLKIVDQDWFDKTTSVILAIMKVLIILLIALNIAISLGCRDRYSFRRGVAKWEEGGIAWIIWIRY